MKESGIGRRAPRNRVLEYRTATHTRRSCNLTPGRSRPPSAAAQHDVKQSREIIMRAFVPPFFCALVLIPASILAGEPPSQKRYSLKQDEPSTGTHVSRERIVVSTPLANRYSELPPTQHAPFKSHYAQITENDEPPF